jgi:[ribosomal protein S5]-alanine N-acetyltransferase
MVHIRFSRTSDALASQSLELLGRRISLRPLRNTDYDGWRQVRINSHDWLTKWEPMHLVGAPDPTWDRHAFESRNGARNREWQLGAGYGFGLFVDGVFAGEVNMSNVLRGPFQSASIGYWIDQRMAGKGYVPEAVVLLLQFSFEELGLHRIQIPIVPRNAASRRVVDKIGLRDEGTALRYLEINGVWEDHVRYAMTVEEWRERGPGLVQEWLQ